jgi:hypothetical protein
MIESSEQFTITWDTQRPGASLTSFYEAPFFYRPSWHEVTL